MTTLAIANQKGGVGKTTTAVNLAAALADLGDSVLVVDLDPQGSATRWLGASGDAGTILDVFTNGASLTDLAQPSSAQGVDVVAAASRLSAIERILADDPAPQFRLRRAIERSEARWRWILLDLPPSLGMLAVNALTAADTVLVPVETRVMALAGLAALTDTIDAVREDLNPDLRLGHILASRVDSRTRLSGDVVDLLRDTYGGVVLRATVRETVRLAEAPQYSEPITIYDPEGAGAEDYRAVAAEVREREG